jgi:hypothetical protein
MDDLPSRPPWADRPPRARRTGRRRGVQDAAAGAGDASVFWTSPARSFTIEELRACEVPRKTGLAILGLVAANDARLSPSAVANVLRGASTCDAVARDPQLSAAADFGAARGHDYGTLLQHVLAMLAKDYLQWVPGGRKKLAIAMRGRHVLTPPKR